jgi:hypothetical protein
VPAGAASMARVAYLRAADSAEHMLILVQIHRPFVTLPRVRLEDHSHPYVKELTPDVAAWRGGGGAGARPLA